MRELDIDEALAWLVVHKAEIRLAYVPEISAYRVRVSAAESGDGLVNGITSYVRPACSDEIGPSVKGAIIDAVADFQRLNARRPGWSWRE